MISMDEALELSRRFVAEVLDAEQWFLRLNRPRARWDLLLLAGSVTRNRGDDLSDLDLFLVLPTEVEKKDRVAPVHVYRFEGVTFEISKFATEKLYRDVENPDSLFVWHRAVLLRSSSDRAERAFRKASTVSEEELRDWLWTRYALYEIYAEKVSQLARRGEALSLQRCVAEIVELLADAVLGLRGEFHDHKWLGSVLGEFAPDVYEELLGLLDESDPVRLTERTGRLRRHFVPLLEGCGFSRSEIESWESCNLERLTFQRV